VRGELIARAPGPHCTLRAQPVDEVRVLGSPLPLLLPGFVDLHVHGGGGHDTMGGGDAALHVARVHAQHGTTSMLATTMTAPLPEIQAALRAVAPYVDRPIEGGARVLGVHLEGPYISPGRLGAQPDFAATATLDDVLALHALAQIRLITIAPEVPGHLELIVALRDAVLWCRSAIQPGATRTAWRHWRLAPPASPTSSTR
jgi:N-acetylglucosamine-6-phosphate deacetylase